MGHILSERFADFELERLLFGFDGDASKAGYLIGIE